MRLQKQQEEMRGQGLEEADQQIFNDLEALYKYGDQWSILTMKHRKQPLDLGEGDSVSAQSCHTPQQQKSCKRKRLEETGCDSAENQITPQDARQPTLRNFEFVERASKEIARLFARRESLCSEFFTKQTDIPELCLELDDIGKQLEKLCIVSQYFNHGKQFKF